MYFLPGSHIITTFVIFKAFPAAKFALCVQKQRALLFWRQSKDVWWLLKFRVESIHFKWSSLIKVELLPEFNDELKELKSELLSEGTSY